MSLRRHDSPLHSTAPPVLTSDGLARGCHETVLRQEWAPPEHARHTRLWERYVLRGESHEADIAELAAEFDGDEATISEEIASIAD